MAQKKILFGVPPKNHVNLALDEVLGMKNLGYKCDTIVYTRNNAKLSILNKLFGVLSNAFTIVRRLYKRNSDFLYLNSRFDYVGVTRDFITILIIRLLYYKKLNVIIKTHGSDLSFVSNKNFFFDHIVLPFVTRQVAVWFFLSHEEKEHIKKHKPRLGKKSYVTQNIIDPARSIASEEFLKQFDLNDDRFKFFFAGRMIHEKGIFTILKSIPMFKKRANCVFIFAGDGDDYKAFKELIKKLELEKFIHLTGFIPEDQCDHFYANVDALVFPTYFDEGFPMALFKSISSGLPVITTQTRAAIDYLKEPDNCLWVDGKSETSVADALNEIYDNKTLQNEMIVNNIKLGKKFTRATVCKDMHQVLSKL